MQATSARDQAESAELSSTFAAISAIALGWWAQQGGGKMRQPRMDRCGMGTTGLGELLRRHRERLWLSQEELAERAGA